MLLIFKILLVPTMIAAISIAGRIWGPRVSGLLAGFPVTVGPVLVFLAIDHGQDFAVSSAEAALAGVISIGLFCSVYAASSQRYGILTSLILGVLGFAVSTFFFSVVHLSLIVTALTVISVLIMLLLAFPEYGVASVNRQASSYDIPFRMIAAASLVLVITYSSEFLGPRLSGLFAPFPIAGTILAGFTHFNNGSEAARRLLDGFLRGLFGMAAFTFIFASQLSNLGIWLTTIVAGLLAVFSISISKRWTRHPTVL